MASDGWNKVLQFLGIVEEYEDEYADTAVGAKSKPDTSDQAETIRAEPTNVRRIPTATKVQERPASDGGPLAQPAPDRPSGTVNVIGGATSASSGRSKGPQTTDRVHVTTPTAFNDVEEIGETFRDATPVIMNLQDCGESNAKRLLDFASGLIYGLDGTIERTGDRIFLLTPSHVDISAPEMDRLRDEGLVR